MYRAAPTARVKRFRAHVTEDTGKFCNFNGAATLSSTSMSISDIRSPRGRRINALGYFLDTPTAAGLKKDDILTLCYERENCYELLSCMPKFFNIFQIKFFSSRWQFRKTRKMYNTKFNHLYQI
jgi:hypothetical protein